MIEENSGKYFKSVEEVTISIISDMNNKVPFNTYRLEDGTEMYIGY